MKLPIPLGHYVMSDHGLSSYQWFRMRMVYGTPPEIAGERLVARESTAVAR